MLRRKLFFVTILVITITAYFDMAGVSPLNPLASRIENGDIIYEGTVKDIEKGKTGYKFTVALDGISEEKSPLVLISYYNENDEVYELYKKKIRFEACLEEPSRRRNPGCFDYGKYLKSKGIYAVASVKSFETVKDDESLLCKVERKLAEKKYSFSLQRILRGSRPLLHSLSLSESQLFKLFATPQSIRHCYDSFSILLKKFL